jgi:hypothetical protein
VPNLQSIGVAGWTILDGGAPVHRHDLFSTGHLIRRRSEELESGADGRDVDDATVVPALTLIID